MLREDVPVSVDEVLYLFLRQDLIDLKVLLRALEVLHFFLDRFLFRDTLEGSDRSVLFISTIRHLSLYEVVFCFLLLAKLEVDLVCLNHCRIERLAAVADHLRIFLISVVTHHRFIRQRLV